MGPQVEDGAKTTAKPENSTSSPSGTQDLIMKHFWSSGIFFFFPSLCCEAAHFMKLWSETPCTVFSWKETGFLSKIWMKNCHLCWGISRMLKCGLKEFLLSYRRWIKEWYCGRPQKTVQGSQIYWEQKKALMKGKSVFGYTVKGIKCADWKKNTFYIIRAVLKVITSSWSWI